MRIQKATLLTALAIMLAFGNPQISHAQRTRNTDAGRSAGGATGGTAGNQNPRNGGTNLPQGNFEVGGGGGRGGRGNVGGGGAGFAPDFAQSGSGFGGSGFGGGGGGGRGGRGGGGLDQGFGGGGGGRGGRNFGGADGGFSGGRNFGGADGGFSGGRSFGGADGGFSGGSSYSGGGGPGGGGRRGGGNPAGFLQQLDLNGNGQLDLDEMQGRAAGLVQRLAANNPRIDMSRPISITLLVREMENARGGDSFGGGFGSGIGGFDAMDRSTASKPEPLVPDFSQKEHPSPPPGFGSTGDAQSKTKASPEDRKEAEDRLRRSDENRDGFLDAAEMRDSRWQMDPLQFDRNQDNRLSLDELVTYFSRMREMMGEDPRESGRRSAVGPTVDNRRGGGRNPQAGAAGQAATEEGDGKDAILDPWKDRSSLRLMSSTKKAVAGLPAWFPKSDTDGDGQVKLHEFAPPNAFNDKVIANFNQFDANRDGIITALEVLAAVQNGVLNTTAPTSSGNTVVSTTKTADEALADTKFSKEGLPPDADDKWVKWCLTRMVQYDINKNGSVTPNEWPASAGDFNSIDKSGDGAVSLAEYYDFRKNKN